MALNGVAGAVEGVRFRVIGGCVGRGRDPILFNVQGDKLVQSKSALSIVVPCDVL